MQATKVLYGHELADLVSEELQFEAADLNGIGITEVLIPGVILTVPESARIHLSNEVIQPRVKTPLVKALHGQTWVDIALQELGNEEELFNLVDLNGAGVTDDLDLNVNLSLPVYAQDKKKIVSLLQTNRPASFANSTAGGGTLQEGIEHWAIEYDFVVS